jgi:hypothetical protein
VFRQALRGATSETLEPPKQRITLLHYLVFDAGATALYAYGLSEGDAWLGLSTEHVASGSGDAAGVPPPPLAAGDDDPYVARLVAEYTDSKRKPVSNVRVRPQRPRSAGATAEAGGGGGNGGGVVGVNAGRTLDEQLQMQYDALVTKRRQVHQAKVRPLPVAVCGSACSCKPHHPSDGG